MKFIKTIILSLTLMMINSSLSLSLNNNQHIPVFLAADDNYAPYVATTMASILKNTKSHVDFYVLSNKISQINQQKIRNTKKFFPNSRFSVRFREIDMKKFEKFNGGFSHITITAYVRWMIPDLYPNLNKAIYLDDDIIVVGDIAELYNQNLEGNIVGAIPDVSDISPNGPSRYKLLKKYGEFKNEYVWNSGVYLIDCQKWRENDITNKLITQKQEIIDYHEKHNLKLGSADQDTLNVVLQDYKVLPLKYNMHPFAIHKCKKQNNCNQLLGQEGDELLKDAIIIHYATPEKPWKNNKTLMGEKFWQVVPYTDFADEIKQIHDNYQRDMKIMKNSDKNANKVNKYVRRKVKLVYILLGILIGLNAIVLFVLVRRRK